MFGARNRYWWLIVAGTLIWSLTMIKSGLRYDYGLGFWGPNGHDGVWHSALIASISQGRWDMPIFAGESIKNYHLGFDLLLAVVRKLTSIPISHLYFQITPPLLALAIGWLTYKLTRNYWSVFFVYFGGSFGWVLSKGESTFWSQQAISTLLNPPFALSLVLLLVGLILLQKQKWWLAGLVFGLLPQIKVYAGLLSFAGLIVAGVKNRNLYKTLAVALPIYMVTNYQLLATGSALLVWQPGWYLETMMSLSDRVGWPRFYSAMTNYRLGGQWLKSIVAYLVALGIFLVGNLGTRVVGVFAIKKFAWVEVFMLTVITGGVATPMFFLQKGTPWNTIQFFYYSLFFLSILAGVAMAKVKSRWLATAVVLATLPTTWQTLQHYLPSRPPAMLPTAEAKALYFLSTQPQGTVLTYPFDPVAAKAAEISPPRPLYLYESTAYVAAFSGQPSYLEDEVNLNITGYDWPARRQSILDFFAQSDPTAARDFLQQNNISYIYLADVSRFRPQLGEADLGASTIYGDGRVAVWRVAR